MNGIEEKRRRGRNGVESLFLTIGDQQHNHSFQQAMKKAITKISEKEIIMNYPIKSRVNGWFFKQIETSNNAWTVEGMDQWGRKVSRSGGEPEELLMLCEQDAEAISKETNTE